MSTVSKAATLVRATNPTNPPFLDGLALVFGRESGRYELCQIDASGAIGDPVLEVEPSGGGKFNLRPLANPGPGWLTADGWPVVSGYTKNP